MVEPLEKHTDGVTSVSYSPCGRHIVSGSWDKTIQVWNAENGNLVIGPLEGHTNGVTSVAFSPDGRHIVSGSDDKTIQIWNAETGDLVTGPLEGHTDGVTSVACSPDGKHIISGSWDMTIHIWNAETGDLMAGPLEGHSNLVNSVIYSPDGKHIVSGSEDRTIRVWNAELGCLAAEYMEVDTDSVSPIECSSGFHHIPIQVSTENGNIVAGIWEGHTRGVTSVAYSPDGRHIVSGSHDKTIQVWNAETGDLMAGLLEGHTNHVADSQDHVPNATDVDTDENQPLSVFDLNFRFKLNNSWLCGPKSEILCWVPPECHAGLFQPRNHVIIGQLLKTRLDFSKFQHGTMWTKCSL